MANREWKLTVDVDKIIHIDGDDFEATISATYTHGNQVVEEKMVQLFVPGAELIEPQETDENGKVVTDGVIIHTNAKKITIEAQAVGYATRGRKTITLPRPEAEKKKKPADLEIKSEGKDGKYFINMTIIDAEGVGIKGKIKILTGGKIKILEPEAIESEGSRDIDIDEQGVAFVKLEVAERQQEFRFLVLGTSIDKILRLSGPKKPIFPPCPPPTPEDLSGGFWGPFKAGWRKRKQTEGGRQ